jgi:hypothetical protein
LRYVERVCPVGVRTQPPRSTIWFDMNLPLYSPIAPSAGWKPGYAWYADDVHSQQSPWIWRSPPVAGPAGRGWYVAGSAGPVVVVASAAGPFVTACSHSASLGNRFPAQLAKASAS